MRGLSILALLAAGCTQAPIPTTTAGPISTPAASATVLRAVPTASASPRASSTPISAPTASPGATPRASAFPIPGTELAGRIVFSQESDIWMMNADGSERTQLTSGPGVDFDPAWSPDGTQIAFRSHRDGNEEVYVMSADGSRQTNLTASPRSDYSPAWSPDGERIAFATDRDSDSGGNDIYVVELADGSVERLTRGGGIDEYPSWSPDGTQIAFACSHGILPEGVADFEVCVMNADGSDVRQLTDAPGVSDYPAWSPAGESIAFMSTRGGWPTLPGYVPFGFEPGEFGEYDVYVMDSGGGNVRNVTNNGRESEQFPAWSPDSRFLVFSRYGCLIVATPDGLAETQVTGSALCADGFPDWRE